MRINPDPFRARRIAIILLCSGFAPLTGLAVMAIFFPKYYRPWYWDSRDSPLYFYCYLLLLLGCIVMALMGAMRYSRARREEMRIGLGMPMTRRHWTLILVGVTLLVALGMLLHPVGRAWLRDGLGWGWSGVPEPAEVESMRVFLYPTSEDSQELIVFDAPGESIPRVLAALHPYRKDAMPMKWGVMGDLHLERKGGGHFVIHLYRTGEAEGAFSSGVSSNRRVYYRGGTDKGIEDAIRSAYRP